MNNIEKYHELKEKIKALDAELDVVKADIKIDIRATGKDYILDAAGERGFNILTKNREKVDKDKMKFKMSEEDYKECIIKSTYEELRAITQKRLKEIKESVK